MTSTYGIGKWTCGAALAALASCGSEAGTSVAVEALRGAPPVACREAVPLDFPQGAVALAGDTTYLRHGPTGCGRGPGQYHRFTLDRRALVYADTFGSAIDAVVGIAPETCGELPLACGDAGCGHGTSQLVAALDPGTYHVFVGGRTARDRGPWVLHLRRDTASLNQLGPIGPGTTTVSGGFQAFSGGDYACGWGPYAVAWYVTCPGDAGGAVAVSVCSDHENVMVGFWDPADSDGWCEVADEDVPGRGLCGSFEADDVAGAGLHYVYVGVRAMSVRDVTFTLEVSRP